jgi:hypothetical protein
MPTVPRIGVAEWRQMSPIRRTPACVNASKALRLIKAQFLVRHYLALWTGRYESGRARHPASRVDVRTVVSHWDYSDNDSPSRVARLSAAGADACVQPGP